MSKDVENKMMEHISNGEEDTKKIAKEFVRFLDGKNINVIGMIGDLGAGKTRFVKFIAEELGVDITVNSPTFLIMRKYDIAKKKSDFSLLYHFDWYRITNAEEISVMDWDEIIQDKNNIVFIEWADKALNLLPKNHIKIYFEVLGENMRKISIEEENE